MYNVVQGETEFIIRRLLWGRRGIAGQNSGRLMPR